MEFRLTNSPSFIEILLQTPGPQLFREGCTEVTDRGGLFFGTGALVMAGAYFLGGGAASIPAGLLLMAITYAAMQAKRAYTKYAELQETIGTLKDVGEDYPRTLSKIQRLWRSARFEFRESESSGWKAHRQVDFVL